MLEIRPILSTLRRHKVTAMLLVLEIALTCAIVCNAVFLVRERLDWIHISSGIDEANIVQVRPVNVDGDASGTHARAQATAAALRELPGVASVSLVNQVPLGNESWNSGIKLDREIAKPAMHVTTYYGEHLIDTLGLQLVAGRDFTDSEYAWFDDVVIVTEFMAQRLFKGNALGKTIWYGDEPLRIIGVVRNVVRPSTDDRDVVYGSVIMPIRMVESMGASYVLRTKPGQAASVVNAAAATLRGLDPNRVIMQKRTFAEIRKAYFASDRAMANLLVGVCLALLIVTALGIVGLGSFWVSQRRRQIGVRRALGATRRDVLRYFQTENFLLATMGIALGMVLAYAINIVLMVHYELPRLPFAYLPLGAVILWLLGQAAVFAPAYRASNVPPVEATRGN
ncbi:ABC transporter permease [Bacillus sp. NP157]|nr:ABC transporter permease [Bacillus sp. NP157]